MIQFFARWGLLLIGSAALASPVYLVTLDTTPLPAGNYFLDYQLAGTASTLGTNTVSITNISLGGGAYLNQSLTNGGAGAFNNYTLTDSMFFNEALIGFTRGSSVQYNLAFSNTFPGGFPDTFTFAVLNSQLNSIVSTGLGASLQVSLAGGNATVQTFPAQAAFRSTIPIVTIPGAAVPEPATFTLTGLALAGTVFRLRRRNA